MNDINYWNRINNAIVYYADSFMQGYQIINKVSKKFGVPADDVREAYNELYENEN